MYLVFDTETSGLPKFDLPYDDPSQGRIVQLGLILLDKNFQPTASFCSLIKPNGWDSIHPKAQERHGIPIERCHEYGIQMDQALDIFDSYCELADIILAYGLKFDSTMVDIEQTNRKNRMPIKYDWRRSGICVMESVTSVCGLKQPNGRGKWPKLQEAYKHFYGKEFDKAHDALADCRATADVYKAFKNNHV